MSGFLEGWASAFPAPGEGTCGGCGASVGSGPCGRCGEQLGARPVSWSAHPDSSAQHLGLPMWDGDAGEPGKCDGCGRTYCIGSGCPARGAA